MANSSKNKDLTKAFSQPILCNVALRYNAERRLYSQAIYSRSPAVCVINVASTLAAVEEIKSGN